MVSSSSLRRFLTPTSLGLAIGIALGTTGTALLAGVRGSDRFSDIPVDAFYNDAVGEFVELGIIKGFDDGTYHPDEAVTRGQIAVLLQRLRNEIKGVSTAARRREVSASSQGEQEERETSATRSSSTAGSFRFTLGKFSVRENEAQAAITVIRAGGSEGAVQVNFVAAGGSATASDDYVGATEVLAFAAEETSKQLFITIRNDDLSEGPETVELTLSSPTAGAILGTPATAILTITDDESSTSTTSTTTSTAAVASSSSAGGSLVFSATAYEVGENAGNLTVTVFRAGNADRAVTVGYATTDGTARSGIDYTAASGTLNFAASETQKTFTVSITDRGDIQGNRNLTMKLASPVGAVLGSPANVTLTITDDEVTPAGAGALRLGQSSYRAGEGDGQILITVQRISGTVGQATVQYGTADITARAGQDYTAASGTMTFLPGESKKTFAIPLLKDTPSDPDETVTISLSNPTGGPTLTEPATAVLTINE